MIDRNGLSSTKIFHVWKAMIRRTSNSEAKDYKHYGGRGVTVCDNWNDFLQFKQWSDENGYKEKLMLDRIDNDGNYEPENCRWVSKNIQSRNTRKIMSTNKSGYRGVCFKKDRNKWVAQIVVNNKRKHIGYYDSAIDASFAYDKYVMENSLEHTMNHKRLK